MGKLRLIKLFVHPRYETQRCVVGDHHYNQYSCFGIRVLGTKDNTAYTGVGNIRMWKKIVKSDE